MKADSQLAALEKRHHDLEMEIADAQSHPGADTLQIAELKRRKLQLKDEIYRLKSEATIH